MLLKPYQSIDALKQLIGTAMSKTIDRCFKQFIGAVYMKITLQKKKKRKKKGVFDVANSNMFLQHH